MSIFFRTLKSAFFPIPSSLWMASILLFFSTQARSQAGCTLVCNDLIQVAVPSNGTTQFQPDFMLEGDYSVTCPGATFQAQVLFGNTWLPATNNFIFEPVHIGQTFMARIKELNSGNSCWGNVQVIEAPAQSDTLHFQLCAEMWNDGRPVKGATLTFQPNNPAFPYSPLIFALDSAHNCASVTLVQSDYLPGTTFSYSASMPDSGALNGVNVIDLCDLAQHILGIQPLPSPYAIVAADVNKSGSVTSFDIVESRKLILGIYHDFPSQKPWQMYPDYCHFSNPANPFGGNCQTEISLSELMQLEGDTAKVIAVKSGDVNGDVWLNNVPFVPSGVLDSLTLIIPQGQILAGSTVNIPLKFNKDLWFGGMQTNMYLNPDFARLDSISSGAIPLPFPTTGVVFFNPVTGSLRTAFVKDLTTGALFIPAGTTLFYLHIKVLQNAQLEDILKMVTTDFNARNFAIGSNCTGYFKMDATYAGAVPTFAPEISGIRLQAPSPNPYAESTFLELELESPKTAMLEVTDLTGRILYSETKELSSGINRWEIQASTMPEGSFGIWRLSVGGQTATGKLMRK